AKSRGRVAEATEHLRERLRLQLALGDEAGTAETHFGLGTISFSSGDLPAAESSFEAALQVAERMTDFRAAASALEGLAFVMHERGLRSRCATYLDSANALREEHGLAPDPVFRSLAAVREEYDRAAKPR
ncbi:MAG TPA: hypothetical protein VFD39_10050, partial [Trueperaceae bacterium]|nr:hypothetical protein [Trueperaceae bacterium]